MKNLFRNLVINGLLALSLMFFAGCAGTTDMQQTYQPGYNQFSWLNLDTVKAGKFDTGKMWTFEYPPMDYFEEEYNFRPDQAWFDHIRLSALRFANYCSASFVSEDGLVMTNHHCARESITGVSGENEDLPTDGYWAESLEDERQVPDLYVDQLVLIKDVTAQVHEAIDKGTTDEERVANERKIISDIESLESEETGLICSVVRLFNGGKYSLYGYKRYTDVRLVFAPEQQLGYFGGDPDNFTYPRYNMDVTFFRVYDEDGNPLKTDNYFRWSEYGAAPGEAVFVVGNPGSTNRLNTFAQLEFARDIQYPRTLSLLEDLIEVYSETLNQQPERRNELENTLFSLLNSQKAYTGILKGLRDQILMHRKKDFEMSFQNIIKNDPVLNANYGDIWENIASTRNQLRGFTNEFFVFNLNNFTSAQYFFIAEDMIELAEQLKLPEDQRGDLYQGEELQFTIDEIFPEDFDYTMQNRLLEKQIDRMIRYLGGDHHLVKTMTGGRTGKSAADYMLNNSILTSREKIKTAVEKGPDAILNSGDPFIYFAQNTGDRRIELQMKAKEISSREAAHNQKLGRALFEVYGTSIPPDATFTLRLADGVVEGYPYNGTIAPPITTFYGLYDRFYSFNKEFPWSLPEKWQNPPAEFKLETPYNFVSTNDIIGGNSGSPVINRNAEVVGVAFDGNIEGLPGNFIFRPEENRTVSVHSAGMMEAITNLYKAKRLSLELKNGKITEVKKTAKQTGDKQQQEILPQLIDVTK